MASIFIDLDDIIYLNNNNTYGIAQSNINSLIICNFKKISKMGVYLSEPITDKNIKQG